MKGQRWMQSKKACTSHMYIRMLYVCLIAVYCKCGLSHSSSPHRNGRLWTPLDQAADKGYADIIALLIEADAPLEAKDKSSVSVFMGCGGGIRILNLLCIVTMQHQCIVHNNI